MEDKKTFGEFIFKRRIQLGLTQKEFAEKLFITESAVSKWERGLSYPDITLVSEISRLLSVSEHELLTASEDAETRNKEKLAQRYMLLLNRYKYILYFIYASSLLTCFICNLAIQHRLSWFFIVFVSEMLAFSLTLIPLLIPERKGLYTLISTAVSLVLLIMVSCIYTGGNWFFVAFISVLFGFTLLFLPYILKIVPLPKALKKCRATLYFASETILLYILLWVCNNYTGGSWFFTIAVPITTFSLLLPWSMMLIIRYLKISIYHKTAVCLAIAGIFEFCIQGIISFILNDGLHELGFRYNFYDWRVDYLNGNISTIIFVALISLAVIFAVLGSYSNLKSRIQTDENTNNDQE